MSATDALVDLDFKWWQRVPPEELRRAIESFDSGGLGELLGEIRASAAAIAAQLETRGRGEDPDWWRRARHAQGFIANKKRLVSSRLIALQASNKLATAGRRGAFLQRLRAAREAAASGDQTLALNDIIAVLEGWISISDLVPRGGEASLSDKAVP